MAPSTRPVTWPPSYVANAATAPARGSAATTGAHHLLQPGPVRTGRLPARGRVVAPGPAEHPVVQALAADPEPAARASAGPGDEAVNGDGDPCEHLAHRLSPLPVRPPARLAPDAPGGAPERRGSAARKPPPPASPPHFRDTPAPPAAVPTPASPLGRAGLFYPPA